MKLSIVICTYKRPQSLATLLFSIDKQSRLPDEVVIIDGSPDNATKNKIEKHEFNFKIKYFKVNEADRGLTKQRNIGIEKTDLNTDLISFLDDDLVLDKNYLFEIEKTFLTKDDAVGVGGIITNDYHQWEPVTQFENKNKIGYFYFDGWKRKENKRYILRKLLGLVPTTHPAKTGGYSHERSVGFLPPTGKTYEVDFIMGGVATYKKKLFDNINFSEFFVHYGLYEDKDFSLRARKFGKLYVNTNAQVEHFHDPLGRPNSFRYGKMVVWNGWRVWRVSNPNPSIKQKIQWWTVTLLLTKIRLLNSITGPKRRDALSEYAGRMSGMIKLLFTKPSLKN